MWGVGSSEHSSSLRGVRACIQGLATGRLVGINSAQWSKAHVMDKGREGRINDEQDGQV